MSVDSFLLSANTTDLNYPEIRPTLDLNFARVKALDSRITFARSSGGSYVGADGFIKYAGVNEARFDHDPVTGESLGLLVEEPRTNSFTWSEDFSQGKSDIGTPLVVTPNATTAPNGTLTADKLSITPSGLSNTSSAQQFNVITSVVNQKYSLRCFLKMGKMRYVRFGSTGGGAGGALSIDLLTGTITSILGTFDSVGIFSYPNGWYMVSFTFTAVTVTGLSGRIFALDPNGINTTFSGSGGDGFYIWGIQLEAGAFPTSYIPTQGSTRTRAADNASITGINFSSWYRQDEGTIYAEAINNNISGAPQIARLRNSADIAFRLDLFRTAANSRGAFFVSDSTTQVNIFNPDGTWPVNSKAAICAAYRQDNFVLAINGSALAIDTSGTVPASIDQLSIANQNSIANQYTGTIRRFTFWPKRLSNAQLQALTR